MDDTGYSDAETTSAMRLPRTPGYRISGVGKFLSDAISVFEIYFIPSLRHWYLTILLASGFPIPWFYVTRAIAPDDPQVIRRLVAATLVFGVAFSIGMLVGQNVVAQRFIGTLKLLISMPMSKGAYVLGSLAYSSVSGIINVVVLMGFGLLAGVDILLGWGLVPCLVLTVLTMAGLTLFIVSFAPSLQAGNISTSLVAVMLAALSPVYFTMDQAPPVLKQLGYISPLRYAADGIEKSLSGRGDVWTEIAVLAGFAVVTMSLGLWRMPWREN